MLRNETTVAMSCIVCVTFVALICAPFVDNPRELITLIYSNAITAIGSLATGKYLGSRAGSGNGGGE